MYCVVKKKNSLLLTTSWLILHQNLSLLFSVPSRFFEKKRNMWKSKTVITRVC